MGKQTLTDQQMANEVEGLLAGWKKCWKCGWYFKPWRHVGKSAQITRMVVSAEANCCYGACEGKPTGMWQWRKTSKGDSLMAWCAGVIVGGVYRDRGGWTFDASELLDPTSRMVTSTEVFRRRDDAREACNRWLRQNLKRSL